MNLSMIVGQLEHLLAQAETFTSSTDRSECHHRSPDDLGRPRGLAAFSWRHTFPVQTAQRRKAVLAVLTLGWGVFLFIIGILLIPEAFPVTFAFGRIVRPTMMIADGLHFLWSLILVVFATRTLIAAIRRKSAPTGEGT